MQKIEAIFEFAKSINVNSLFASVTELHKNFQGLNAVFSTSFSLEDQVITHLIATHALPVRIFTLDTGRHFAETYRTLEATRERYALDIQVMFPQSEAVERLMSAKGAYSFYEGVAARQECCGIRKVEPLTRALKGADLWLTGIRRVHSVDRENLPYFEIDHTHAVVKFHPLLDWSDATLKAFIDEHNIPYNKLYDKGFLSIGCEPCTRAVEPGGGMRSGRWWWESPDKKECGLHIHR